MKPNLGILHYSAPPIIGGVEAVMGAHLQVMIGHGYPTLVIAGEGDNSALAREAEFILIPEISDRHPNISKMNESLDHGRVPPGFEEMVAHLAQSLEPVLAEVDNLIVHNIFTKHFNIPLTAALFRLLDAQVIANCIAWCHDFTWTSPSSGSKVFDRYPWDLLRTQRADISYVVVSKERQRTLADLFGCPPKEIKVIYNGVDPRDFLGLSPEGQKLVRQFGILESELVLLMPVRVTQAKNIELALNVVAAIKERGVIPKLVLTGPPDPHDPGNMEYFESLRDLRRELGVEQEMRFVFESGPDPDEPYYIEIEVVGDLLRASDVMFIPSHREGFGMSVLEAGLLGVPVASTAIPAAEEIGGENVTIFSADDPPEEVAQLILKLTQENPLYRHKRRVRQHFTWEAIFERDIEPLLKKRDA